MQLDVVISSSRNRPEIFFQVRHYQVVTNGNQFLGILRSYFYSSCVDSKSLVRPFSLRQGSHQGNLGMERGLREQD